MSKKQHNKYAEFNKFDNNKFTAYNIATCKLCLANGNNHVGHRPGPNCPTVQGFTCGYCHEKGHTIKHCERLKENKQKQATFKTFNKPQQQQQKPEPKPLISSRFAGMEETEMPSAEPKPKRLKTCWRTVPASITEPLKAPKIDMTIGDRKVRWGDEE